MITEFEAKFLNINIDLLRNQLIRVGALQITEQRLMRRKVFDFSSTESTKQWVRVRDEGDKIHITLKKISDATKIHGTQELEFGVDNFDKACNFLILCGLIPKAYQENYRESWSYQGAFICIDTWPGLPTFVEVEGASEFIVNSVAQAIGLDLQTSYFGTMDMVYEDTLGIPVNLFNQIDELTFENIFTILNMIGPASRG